jgi:hypothetical protein
VGTCQVASAGAAVVEDAEAAVVEGWRGPQGRQVVGVAQSPDGIQRHARYDAGVELPDPDAGELRELGAAGVPVLSQVSVETIGAKVTRRVDSLGEQRVDRGDVGLGGIGVSEAHPSAPQVAHVGEAGVGARDEVRAPPAVGVAHGERLGCPACLVQDLHVSEVRVPRGVQAPSRRSSI